jgi:hypothetical protein
MNMKKRYISPTSQVVLLDMQQMLALSPGSGVDGSVRAPGESQLSRESDDFGASEYWDTSEDY